MAQATQNIYGQASWALESDQVSLAVTEKGGMMAPVSFFRSSSAPFEPYYINPWHSEKVDVDDEVLEALRGDFFCMPFGAGGEYRGVSYPTHGETASAKWELVEDAAAPDPGTHALVLRMSTTAPAARVTKQIRVKDGQNALYIQHRIEGGTEHSPLGHHATLAGTVGSGDGSGDGAGGGGFYEPERLLISTSRIRVGRTESRHATHFAGGEYFSLIPDMRFDDLSAVPTIWRDEPNADCSVFPARPGFVDVLTVCADPDVSPAWTVAVDTQAGALWYSLKDPRILSSTVFWMENYGRHQEPWRGRNSCIGLEEVCGHLADGMGASVEPNDLSAEGVPTAVDLSRPDGVTVNVIEGAVRVPEGFGHVRDVRFTETGLTFVDAAGRTAFASVDHDFVHTGRLS